MLTDIRYALRVLIKSPAAAVVATLTLALGIGANTAIFSVVQAVLVRPLPFRDPGRILTVWQNDTRAGVTKEDPSPANFLDWKERSRTFERLAAMNPWTLEYINPSGEPEALQTALVTEDFFPLLGVPPILGRTLEPDDFRQGTEQVVVLAHGLWQRKFGGDPAIIGQSIVLDGKPALVPALCRAGFACACSCRSARCGPRSGWTQGCASTAPPRI
jgi:hypothetical protein